MGMSLPINGCSYELNKDDITKYSLKRNPQGQRKKGRPKNTWRRQTNKEIVELDLADVEATAQDRCK